MDNRSSRVATGGGNRASKSRIDSGVVWRLGVPHLSEVWELSRVPLQAAWNRSNFYDPTGIDTLHLVPDIC